MTLTRKLIYAFWIFIVIMLVWQFYTYNEGLKQDAIDHPKQDHFIFLHTNAAPGAPAQPHYDGAKVLQTAYSYEDNTPSRGSFTCHVTLKNVGNAKAVNVQVKVRPFRGTSKFDDDVSNESTAVLSDDDPVAQFGDWITFPDLAPGESSTQSTVFISRGSTKRGTNPKPEIIFETAKVKQPPSH